MHQLYAHIQHRAARRAFPSSNCSARKAVPSVTGTKDTYQFAPEGTPAVAHTPEVDAVLRAPADHFHIMINLFSRGVCVAPEDATTVVICEVVWCGDAAGDGAALQDLGLHCLLHGRIIIFIPGCWRFMLAEDACADLAGVHLLSN